MGAVSKVEDATLIKKRLKAHRNVLVSELEPRAIAHVLSKSKAFPESAIDSVLNADSCNKRVEILLSLVEDGGSEVVEEFVTALKDLGYSSIVELIDPPDIHNRAGKCLEYLYLHVLLYYIYIFRNNLLHIYMYSFKMILMSSLVDELVI